MVETEVEPAAVTSANVMLASPTDTSTFVPASVLFAPGASIVHAYSAGEPSTFGGTAVSDARTSKVCGPTARPSKTSPLWQPANGALSSEHSNVSAAGAVRLSEPLKRNVADVLVVGFAGPSWIVVFGSVVSAASIVHAYAAAGLSSMLWPFSGSVVALTSNTCSPLDRSYGYGDVHGMNGSTSGSTASRRHSYVEPGWSTNESSPVALVLIAPSGTSTPPASFVMVVRGGAMTFQV